MSIDTVNGYISQVVLPPKEEGDIERLYLIKDQKAQDNIELLQSNLTSLDTELDMLDTKIDNIDIPNISNLVSTDDLTNTVSGLISKKETNNNYVTWSSLLTYYSNNTTLNNNYAHITDGIIDNATINHEDVNGLSENYAHVNNNYIIDNATINHENVNGLYENYAHVNNGIINNATISYTNINDLDGNYAHVTDGVIDNATISYININDLDDNYARVINGIIIDANIDYTRINNLNDNYAHITGGLIDNASIRYTNIEDLDDNYAHVTDGIIDNANIDYAHINNLDANYAHITNGVIDNAYIDQAKVNNLDANYAHIQNGVIDNANIDQANINNLDANYAHITNGTIDNANISYANVSNLNAHYAHLEDGVIDNALIGYANVDQLDSHYAEIDMANVNNAWIENGVIKDAAISDAKIIGVSANKLTAGRIDASNINVINLRADNLIVTKINGQPVIGGYTLVSPEISGYIDKNPSQENWYEFYNNLYTLTVDTFVDPNKNYYTTSDSVELYDQTTIDSMFEDVNARIDSQIETWTVDELPTLMNYPAENWTTNDLKDAHIGDICYVINASSDYNGYTYRFAYDNTSHQYSWVLIQDNQVTAALGRITQLETFNNQLVHWEDATDEGVITVRGRFTELSGRIDKTVKSSIQLWYTKANTTAPNAPTSQVTSISTNGGAWTTVVPAYDENYPNYFYCWQYQYEDDTYGWSAVIYDQATTETQEAARTVPPDLLDYISDNIETIQEQVLDGQLEIWYGSINPSTNNAPANEWASDKYEDHVGDLYYNTTDGSVWQWTENNSTYSWSQIPDSAASTALAAAQSAQATADGKRKIFTTTPTVPYDIGDLWVTGSTVKYANVAKTSSQTYNENDWSLTATDDTTANANIKSSIQLWYTSNSTTPPNKPYTDGSSNHVTSTSTSGNTWTTVVPVYNSSTSKYHYCYQQQRGDGTYQWTIPVYDDATTTAMAKAQNALPASTFENFEQTTFKEVTDTIDEQKTTITQLQTRTERALSQGVEYIVGTHGTTATNVWTGVTQDEQLYTGKQIAFYMTSAGVSSSAATLNLQLSDGTWSGPINVKINDTNVTNQYPINTVLKLTYDGGTWKSDNYNSDTNYYDREAYKASVTANEAISADRIGIFGTDGKLKLLSNSAFDTSYPILYIGTAYTTNALTQTNNYTFWGTPFNLTNTHSITGAAAGKPVYIVGTLNGNIMTPTTTVLTCTVPTQEDNLFYIRLGLMSTATNAVLESQHPIYAFMDGKFQQTTQSVVTVSNTVNTVKQTADTNSAKISNLTQTLGTNADGTTAAEDIVHQISDIEQDLNGISTRVSKTEVSLRGTFATSSTAASTAAKVATIFPENNDFELYTGATITVKFTNNNTTSVPTLNINSTGVKPIKTYSGTNLSEAEYKWDAGSTMTFVYDGTNWRIQDSTELTRLKNNESRITQTANSITSLVANNETYTAPDGTTKTNTIRSAIKQNADNIDLRVEKANVIASINASVETDGTSTVKISADKVNIEGAAIFNSGRLSTTSLNDTYDSKGSASAAQIAAINTAAADATQKANDAQSAAEATASADATQKANAAQSAAISAAATDATQKANAAKEEAISAAAQNTTNQVNAVNKQEQLIYIQAVSGTLSIPDNKKPTTWVTNTGESVSSDETGLTPVWTTKHPTYRSKYPVLFVATQRQTVGGTLTCTTPLKDDTTTVIDGGHITTGTIDATNVNVTNIDASEIKTGTLAANRIESKSLTIDKFTDESQADILNSRIGQPNLTPYFSRSINDVYSSTNTNGYWTQAHATVPAVTNDWSFEQSGPDGAGGCAHFDVANTGTSIAYLDSYIRKTALDLKPSTKYTFFVEWFGVTSSGGTPILYTTTQHGGTNGVNDDYFSTTTSVSITSGSGSSYISATTRANLESGCYNRIRTHLWVGTGITTSGYIRISLYEGEYSGPYKPYVDQTLSNRVKTAETAIEQNTEDITLRATKTEVQQVRPAYASSSTAAGTAAKVATIDPAVTGYALYKGATVSVTFSTANTAATPTLNLNSTGAKQIRSYTGAALSEAEYKWAAGATIDLVYDGTYWRMQDGGSVKRVTAAEASIRVNADNIESKVSKDGVISSINQSAETVKIDASKVEINGTAIFSAISSDVDDAITDKGYATTIQAQNYAATAKTEAVNAAAADATSKANAAEAAAKAAIPSDISELNNDTGFITNADVPTKISELTNDSGFQNATQVNTAITSKGYQTSSQVESAITSKGYATTTQAQEYANTAEQNAKAAIPTDISDLNNDSGFITSADVVQNWFATCTTAAGTKDKVATITPATTSFSLKAGVTVNVKFSNTNSYSATASSNVTLNVNSTGAKNIYYGASSTPTGTNTTPFGRANYTNTYVYDGTYWIWVSSSADNNSDTYNRTRMQNVITAATAITASHIICGTSTGYKNIAAGVQFDLSYPLLYAGSAIAAAGTGDNNYLQINSINAANNGTIETGTNYSTLYLKGTVVGNLFTIAASPFLTTVQPTTENGFFYIPLGVFYNSTTNIYFNSSKDLYAYLDGRFRQVTPTEIVASQKIYYRSKVSGTVPKPTAWVTLATNKYNDTVSVGNGGWSTKVTPIASSKAENVTKYLYLYTCEQRKRLDGTVECTAVTLDENTTIIDGGNIITNSITANQIAANAVTADKLAANSLTIGKFTDADKAKVDNSYVQIGGRNLLHNTGSPSIVALVDYTEWAITSGGNGVCSIETITDSPVPAVTRAFRIIGNTSGNRDFTQKNKTLESDFTGPYRFSAWVRGVGGSVNALIRSWNNTAGNAAFTKIISGIGTDWTYIEFEFVPNGNGAKIGDLLDARFGLTGAGSIEYIAPKLERGNKATDWTPAPEDMATNTSVDQTYVQNLTPYFQMDMTQTSDEYWANLTYERFSRLGDGWAHFEYTNSGSSTVNNYIKLKLLDFLEPGGKYTLLAEFKNVSISADGGSFYSQQGNDVQVWGDRSYCGFTIGNAEIRALSGGAGTFYKTLTLLTADSKDPSGTVRGTLPKTSFMSINQQVQAGQTVSYDLRLSLYANGYTGTYKPYIGSQLYATGKSLSDSQDFLDDRIDGLDGRTTNAENLLETTSSDLDKVVGQLEQLEAKYGSDKTQRDQWLDFTRSEGLVIGDNESTFKTVIGSESMEFKNGDITLAKASGTEFGADVMRSEELHIGKWMWTKRNEGNNLSLKWVG